MLGSYSSIYYMPSNKVAVHTELCKTPAAKQMNVVKTVPRQNLEYLNLKSVNPEYVHLILYTHT